MSPCGAVGTYTVHRPTTKRLDHGDFERSQITGEAETSDVVGNAILHRSEIGCRLRDVRFVPKDGVIGRRSCG